MSSMDAGTRYLCMCKASTNTELSYFVNTFFFHLRSNNWPLVLQFGKYIPSYRIEKSVLLLCSLLVQLACKTN